MFEELVSMENLNQAAKRVLANGGSPGIDGQTIRQFKDHLEKNLRRLHQELQSGGYRPRPVKQVLIPKEGKTEMRPLGIPTVRDRVVQTALYLALESIFEGLP